jgi:hypothetical protein
MLFRGPYFFNRPKNAGKNIGLGLDCGEECGEDFVKQLTQPLNTKITSPDILICVGSTGGSQALVTHCGGYPITDSRGEG